jgi:hypothetical protein
VFWQHFILKEILNKPNVLSVLGGGTVEFGCITNILELLAMSIFKMKRLTVP